MTGGGGLAGGALPFRHPPVSTITGMTIPSRTFIPGDLPPGRALPGIDIVFKSLCMRL
jgi:hypothetical protein